MSTAPAIFTPEYYERMRRLERVSWWNAGMRDVAAALLADAVIPREGTLLDVGCGSGQTMVWFERLWPGWRTLGLDVALDGVQSARAAGCRVCLGSALTLPLPDHSVDLVVTLDVLQHLPLGGGDVRALGEIHRVLKPGGHVFIRTNAQAFPQTPDDAAFDFRKYTPQSLAAVLQTAGFQVHRLSRINALLGLAEVPRELRARRSGPGYHGLLAQPPLQHGWMDGVKAGWLRWEGELVRQGIRLPFGRSIIALCRR